MLDRLVASVRDRLGLATDAERAAVEAKLREQDRRLASAIRNTTAALRAHRHEAHRR